MKLVLFSLAAAMLASTPAFADGARVEVQGGAGWSDGGEAKGVIGGAAGYDWSLPGGAFVGVEESIDKTIGSHRDARWATSGRIGLHITPADKLYATAGYNYGQGPNGTDVGAGLEHSFAGPIYGKVEYKHYFNEDDSRDSNAVLTGVGVHF